jgi:hypothetical protein
MRLIPLLPLLTLIPLALSAPPRRQPFTLTRPILARQNNTTVTDPLPPACDLTTLQQPPSTLLPPPANTTLILIALGLGTQNYTCSDPSGTPTSIGAIAQLYNASCAITSSNTNKNNNAAPLLASSSSSSPIGTHFFLDTTTPDFDITSIGNTQAKKVQDDVAPNAASDVKWLRLEAVGSTSGVKMIYRLNTVGGVAPGSCVGRGLGEVVTVGYEAQYWVYA